MKKAARLSHAASLICWAEDYSPISDPITRSTTLVRGSTT